MQGTGVCRSTRRFVIHALQKAVGHSDSLFRFFVQMLRSALCRAMKSARSAAVLCWVLFSAALTNAPFQLGWLLELCSLCFDLFFQ